MSESLFTLSIAGLIAGFIFSVPVAGPISILITSNALKGRLRYCQKAAIGASFADFVYVFIAVLGLTSLYNVYRPAIPYILAVGALFLLGLGIKIIRTKLSLESMEDDSFLNDKLKNKGGFRTGFLINFLNPTLFLGWLTSSFFTISIVASLGFNTGGLHQILDENVKAINQIEAQAPDAGKRNIQENARMIQQEFMESYNDKESPWKMSIAYAFFLSLGSIIWFLLFARFLVRNRKHIRISIINRIIHLLGMALCGFGIFLGYKAFSMISILL